MAITPRTIFSSAAPATVAAVSLLAFTAIGTVAYMSSQECTRTQATHAPAPTAGVCDNVAQALGADKSRWSEGDWIHYATCFEQRNNSRLAADAASDGLNFYPRSEPLFNMKGYHEIVLDKHAKAVRTLETGLDRIGEPYSGVLENNLAWAALWAPREMSTDRARKLYRNALTKESNVCAYIHTGLWVEYAKARESSGVEKFEALREFDELRTRYEPCLDRLDRGDWKTVVEITGAAAMYGDLEARQSSDISSTDSKVSGDELMREVAEVLKQRYSSVSIDAVCSEAMPVSTTHHTCVEQLSQSLAQVAHDELREKNADTIPAGSSGGGPCPAMVR